MTINPQEDKGLIIPRQGEFHHDLPNVWGSANFRSLCAFNKCSDMYADWLFPIPMVMWAPCMLLWFDVSVEADVCREVQVEEELAQWLLQCANLWGAHTGWVYDFSWCILYVYAGMYVHVCQSKDIRACHFLVFLWF